MAVRGKGKMLVDSSYDAIQVFAPKKVVSVTADTDWTPDADDIAFAVTEDCNYTIDGSAAIPIVQGSIRGIVTGIVYTFSVPTVIEVM